MMNDSLATTGTAAPLAQRYKDKYESLRHAYERRILSLTGLVSEVCNDVARSEFVSEMRSDPSSSAFIPNHFAEILTSHLATERESFLHETLDAVAEWELALRDKEQALEESESSVLGLQASLNESRRGLALFDAMKNKLEGLQAQYAQLCTDSGRDIDDLRAENRSLKAKVERLESEAAFRTAESELLFSRSIAGSHRDESFSNIGAGNSRFSQLMSDAAAELASVKTENSRLIHHCEQQRLALDQKQASEELMRLKMQELMEQVQGMVAEEKAHTTQIVRAVVHKSRAAREALSDEVTRVNDKLDLRTREASAERALKEDVMRDLKSVESVLAQERSAAAKDKRLAETLQSKCSELERALVGKERELVSKEGLVARLEADRRGLEEQYAVFKRNVVEERRALKQLRDDEAVRQSFDQRLSFQNALRHSFTFGDLPAAVVGSRSQRDRDRSPSSQSTSHGGSSRPSYREMEDALRQVRAELSEVRGRAMREQEDSAATLTVLRAKFDKLLRSHETNLESLRSNAQRASEVDAHRRKYETALLGVLKSLVTLGLLPDSLAREVVEIAMRGGDEVSVEAIYRKTGDSLNGFVVDLNATKEEVQQLRRESRRVKELEAALDQCERDKAMLSELGKMEKSTQLRTLEERQHETLTKASKDAADREARLRKAFESEFDTLRKGFEAKIATLTANLKIEHRRRKEAQQQVLAKEETMQRLFAEHDRKVSSFADGLD